MGKCEHWESRVLMIVTIFIFIFGLMFLYSASVFLDNGGDSSFVLSRYATKQLFYGIIGVSLMILAYQIPSRFWYKNAYILLVGGIFLMVLVFIPGIGFSAGGATRWIRVGPFSFQPSEFVKFAMIVYLARSLPNKKENVKDFWMGFFPYMFILSVVAVILFFQRDLGTFVIVGYITFLLLFIGGSPLRYIGGALAIGGALVVVKEILNTGYRLNRIKAFLFPWEYFKSYGYQLAQSYLALSNGGLTGRSPGAGLQKLHFLPEAHTDFIFAIIGEEGGFVFTSLFLLGYLYILYLGFKITLHQKKRFKMMLALGITALFGIEVFINLGVVTGMLPTKGLPLPLVSYGGSNLLMTFLMMGVLARLGRSCEKV